MYKPQNAIDMQKEREVFSPNNESNAVIVIPLSDQKDANSNLNVGLQGSYQSVKTLKPKGQQDSERMQQTFT